MEQDVTPGGEAELHRLQDLRERASSLLEGLEKIGPMEDLKGRNFPA
jgi:hypothetical protein